MQVKNAVFTTNPCRIQYCTKEIVVFREDLIPKMFRCRVNSPTDDLPEHVSCLNLVLDHKLYSCLPPFIVNEHAYFEFLTVFTFVLFHTY